MRSTRRDAYDLLHRGSEALARVEANGLKIDTHALQRTADKIDDDVKRLTGELRAAPEFRDWRKRFGEKTNLGSREQLGQLLFGVMKLKGGEATAKTALSSKIRYKADEEVLQTIKLPFVEKWRECESLKSTKSKFINGILHEVCEGYLHPFQNLNTVKTYRSSSSFPNGHNFPTRDEEQARLVRSVIIPRRGRVLIEVDFKGAEVCAGACYHKDPSMIRYITDPTKDMHRDMAAQIFFMRRGQVPKPVRQDIKSNFVFAEFYGAWYKTCAPRIWKNIDLYGLTNHEGVPLKEHLKKHGITELGECRARGDDDGFVDPEPGTFEYHLWEIEKDFWGRRFRGYAEWKRTWFEKYQQRGYFDMLTGFRCAGVFTKKEAVNYPIQGSAFHCLLWALIELDRWLRKHKMKSLIVGQIHDSMLLDCTEGELADILAYVQRLITKKLPKAWPWIIVPLTVEIEGSRENWFKKKPLAI
jgi:DNA polymerase-1